MWASQFLKQQEYLVSNVSSLLLFGRPNVTWYFHFPLQYFSITTFYISQFSRRSRIRSAPQRNPHFQIKERKNMKYCQPFHVLIFSSISKSYQFGLNCAKENFQFVVGEAKLPINLYLRVKLVKMFLFRF